jgi:hypothetical protein
MPPLLVSVQFGKRIHGTSLIPVSTMNIVARESRVEGHYAMSNIGDCREYLKARLVTPPTFFNIDDEQEHPSGSHRSHAVDPSESASVHSHERVTIPTATRRLEINQVRAFQIFGGGEV